MLLSLSTVSLTLTLQIAVPAPAPASTAAPRPADAAVPWALPQPASDPLAAGQEGRPYLGVTVDTGSGGLVVSEVAKGSAAERAGLKVGDRLRRAGDQQLGDFDDLIEAVRTAGVGRPLLLVVQRGDRELALPAVIGVRPAEGQPPLPTPPPAPPAQGLETPPRPAARSGGIAAAPAAPTLPFEVRSGLSTVPARPFLGVTLSDAGNGARVGCCPGT
jgi:membrane-associated protease RseP (regulator of RpoE activity)